MEKHIYADECGNFDFSAKSGASKYFILTTVTLEECSVGDRLLQIRRSLARGGHHLDSDSFHATEDEQVVRDAVFDMLRASSFRIDATILEKRKAYPGIRMTDERFYRTAWYRHMKHVGPKVIRSGDNVLVVAASLGTKKKRKTFASAVTDVIRQIAPHTGTAVACWPAASDPCLQVADYCAWAIQRKWELRDTRSYDLIKAKVATEFDLFAPGVNYYY